MDRKTYPMNCTSPEAVLVPVRFQFSGSGGITGLTGSAVAGVTVTGSTYTLQLGTAAPQLLGIHAQLALSPTYQNTASGSLDVMFNGNQLAQALNYFTGSSNSASLSGQSQTLDFVVQGTTGNAVVVPYLSGTNWCFLHLLFLNQNYSRG